MESNNRETVSFQNKELFNIWIEIKNVNERISVVSEYVMEKFKENHTSNAFLRNLNTEIRKFCDNLLYKWRQCNYSLHNFLAKHEVWLKNHTYFNKPIASLKPDLGPGRPRLKFDEKSERTQRRQAAELSEANGNNPLLLAHAASLAARKNKNFDLSAVLKNVKESPEQAPKIRKIMNAQENDHLNYTPQEALAFLLDNNLSKSQYINMTQGAASKNCFLYPSYKKVLDAKNECRAEGLLVTDTMARLPLKNLLEHTVRRIVSMQEEVILRASEKYSCNFRASMILSYGFDGSTGQKTFKQKFGSGVDLDFSDASLFATTVISLRLLTEDKHKLILWNNRTPQSVRFCRPLKLEYVKETKEHILKEKKSLDEEIKNIEEINIILSNGKLITIDCKMFMTLIDGKVLNVLTENKSSQTCPICGSTPKSFLKEDNFQLFQPKNNTLQFGISPLHAWIRFFESILHISYKINIKKWQVRGDELKNQMQIRKREIQRRFWENMSLHVDKPKSCGSGSSNDGNTARRAFSNPKLFSDITEVDFQLINNYRIILICLSCQFPLDLEKFEKFCFKTATIYKEHYSWHPMTATVHKILVHGKQILENTILPAGYFGEEASESRNKLYKQDREFHARKDSRTHNLADIFNRAMDTSDPGVSSVSLEKRIKNRKQIPLPSEVIELLEKSESHNKLEVCPNNEDDDSEDDQLEISLFNAPEELRYLELDSE